MVGAESVVRLAFRSQGQSCEASYRSVGPPPTLKLNSSLATIASRGRPAKRLLAAVAGSMGFFDDLGSRNFPEGFARDLQFIGHGDTAGLPGRNR